MHTRSPSVRCTVSCQSTVHVLWRHRRDIPSSDAVKVGMPDRPKEKRAQDLRRLVLCRYRSVSEFSVYAGVCEYARIMHAAGPARHDINETVPIVAHSLHAQGKPMLSIKCNRVQN